MLSVYNATGIEFVHTFIGGSFVFSLVPMSIALWNTDEMLSERDVTSNEDVQVVTFNNQKQTGKQEKLQSFVSE